MPLKKRWSSNNYSIRWIKRKISMFLIAIILGMSNVILEEDRMVDDTRPRIEQQEIADEPDSEGNASYEDVF